ncbi:MAG: hypothetical protein PHN26_04200 [Eubacteriaceae bacterium]|jgi:hypothetical protein|nr:hypothetical protein [Eubacteriaceae bacterium]
MALLALFGLVIVALCGCGESSLPETIPNYSTQDINGNTVT